MERQSEPAVFSAEWGSGLSLSQWNRTIPPLSLLSLKRYHTAFLFADKDWQQLLSKQQIPSHIISKACNKQDHQNAVLSLLCDTCKKIGKSNIETALGWANQGLSRLSVFPKWEIQPSPETCHTEIARWVTVLRVCSSTEQEDSLAKDLLQATLAQLRLLCWYSFASH